MAKERKVFSIKNFRGIDTTSDVTKVVIERATAGKNFELHSGSFKTRPATKENEIIATQYDIGFDEHVLTKRHFVTREKYKDVFFYVFYDDNSKKVKFKYNDSPKLASYLAFSVDVLKMPRVLLAEANDNLYIFGLNKIIVFDGVNIDYIDGVNSPVKPYVPTLFLGENAFESRNILSKSIKFKMSGGYGAQKMSFPYDYDVAKDGTFSHELNLALKNNINEVNISESDGTTRYFIKLEGFYDSNPSPTNEYIATNKILLIYEVGEDIGNITTLVEKLEGKDPLKFANEDGIIEEQIEDFLHDYDGSTLAVYVQFVVTRLKPSDSATTSDLTVWAKYEITPQPFINEFEEITGIMVNGAYVNNAGVQVRAYGAYFDTNQGGDILYNDSYLIDKDGTYLGYSKGSHKLIWFTGEVFMTAGTPYVSSTPTNVSLIDMYDIENKTLDLSNYVSDQEVASLVKQVWFGEDGVVLPSKYYPAGKQSKEVGIYTTVVVPLTSPQTWNGHTFTHLYLLLSFKGRNVSVNSNIDWSNVKKKILIDENPNNLTTHNYYNAIYNDVTKAFELTINGYSVPRISGDFNVELVVNFAKNRYEDELKDRDVLLKYDIDDLVLIGGKDNHILFNYSSTLPEFVDKYNYYPVRNMIEAGRKPIYAMTRAGDTAFYVFSDTMYVVNELLLESGLRSFSSGYRTNLERHELPRNQESVVYFNNSIIIVNEIGLFHLYLRDNIETDERQIFERGEFAREFIKAHQGFSSISENNQKLYVSFAGSKDVLVLDRDYMSTYHDDYKQHEIMMYEFSEEFYIFMEKGQEKLYHSGVIYDFAALEKDEHIKEYNSASFTIGLLSDYDDGSYEMIANNTLRDYLEIGDELVFSGDKVQVVFLTFDVSGDGYYVDDRFDIFDDEPFKVVWADGGLIYDDVVLERDPDDNSRFCFKDGGGNIFIPTSDNNDFIIYKKAEGLVLKVDGKYGNSILTTYRGFATMLATINPMTNTTLTVRKYHDIEVEWVSAITDFGNDMMEKTMFSMQLLFSNYGGNLLDFGYRTSRFYDKTINIGSEFARIGDLNFEFFSISPRYKHSYNLMRKENNFLYMQFVIRAKGIVGIDGINVLYKNNRVLFGLG